MRCTNQRAAMKRSPKTKWAPTSLPAPTVPRFGSRAGEGLGRSSAAGLGSGRTPRLAQSGSGEGLAAPVGPCGSVRSKLRTAPGNRAAANRNQLPFFGFLRSPCGHLGFPGSTSALRLRLRRSDPFLRLAASKADPRSNRPCGSFFLFRAPRSSLAAGSWLPVSKALFGIAASQAFQELRFLTRRLWFRWDQVRKVGSAFVGTTASRFFLASSTIAVCTFSLAGSGTSCHGGLNFLRPFPSGLCWPEIRD